MTVRRASGLGLAVLSLAFAIIAAATIRSYRDYASERDQLQVIGVVRDLARGVTDLALERSLTQVAMNLPGPVSPELRRGIDGQRQSSDDNFAAVARGVAGLDARPGLRRFGTEFARQREIMAAFRTTADRQMAMADEAMRDRRFVEGWAMEVPVVVRDIEGLRYLLNVPGSHLTYKTRGLLDIGRAAWRIREQGGRERTYLALATFSGQPLAPSNLPFMDRMAADTEAQLTGIDQIVATGAVPDRVVQAVATLRQSYFADYAQLRAQVYEASGGPYPLSGDAFFSRSAAALNTAEILVAVSMDAAMAIIERAADDARRLLVLQAAGLVLVTAGLVWIAWFLRMRMAGRLRVMAGMARELASGKLDQRVEPFVSGDEVGQVAQALAVLRDSARHRVRLEAEARAAQAERSRRAEVLTHLAEGFSAEVRGTLDGLTAAATTLQQTAASLSGGAREASAQAASVSGSADLASANVQTVAAAAAELSSSIQEITRQIGRSTKVSEQAVVEARQTTEAVTQLAEAAGRIDGVVRLISDIAGRTNLLALNATIEAARAGEAGRGFAVVASEVKSLATQTARATSDIATQIAAMQAVAGRTVAAIGRIDATIGSMNAISVAIAASMQEQGTATAQIACNVTEAASSTRSMSGNLATVTQTIHRSSDASGLVLTAAERVANGAGDIQSRVDRYFESMRAA